VPRRSVGGGAAVNGSVGQRVALVAIQRAGGHQGAVRWNGTESDVTLQLQAARHAQLVLGVPPQSSGVASVRVRGQPQRDVALAERVVGRTAPAARGADHEGIHRRPRERRRATRSHAM
jgi:hypothetical protein